nr:reverse transcriptase domain-containing protein [Tanacetum cinerariifolium]
MSFEIIFSDALILMPKFASTLKALIGMAECLALADLGASINLMPYYVWKKLSLPDLTPTCMTLDLADRLISRPVGVAEDVYVKVGSFHFPIDFVVVDFDADPRVPLILERSFLKTGKALIDVFEEGDILFLESFLNDDPSLPPPNQRNSFLEVSKELKLCEAKTEKSLVDEPPVIELKALPPHLEYAFLEGDNKLPVIIAKDLSVEEKSNLITVLKSHKRAIAWKLSDIKGINPEFCSHKILLKEDFTPAVQHQRRVNPKIYDVIKQEDQEKTTFTCPYGTFAYRRMPFGLCNAPGMFQRCMMAIFHDMIEKSMEVFMDDFSVFGDSFQSCLSHLEKMLKRVTHRISTAYHPQTSGQVEVSNRSLKRILERTIGENRASWSDKFDALWPFRTAYKTPIGCTPYKLVYGKACHFPIELEHKAYWALKHANFDLSVTGDHQKVHLNELNELRDHAYENSLIYKEKTKRIHDSKIKNRVFNVGDRVFLFNSRLNIFSGKLKTCWSGPFTIIKVFPYGMIELSQANGPNFKVNGHRVKHYSGGDVPQLVVPDLQTFPLDQ